MKKGTLTETLKNFGLTEKEGEVYLFLGKHGPLKRLELSKQLKMNKGQVYRTLVRLQKKGMVESTLENPIRFTAVSFEKVIDSFIKSKREEVDKIEESKSELLFDWKNISQTELDSSLEKFSVIEGQKKIYSRISQMVNESKRNFFWTIKVFDLFLIENLGILDFIKNKLNTSNIKFNILIQASKHDLDKIKLLYSKLIDFNIRVINPSIGGPIFTRMAIQDSDGIIIFISDKNKEKTYSENEVCLNTNCKPIIEAFLGVFNDTWKDSIELKDWINSMETKKPTRKMYVIKNSKEAYNKYHKIIRSAKKEIIITTSEKGLLNCWKGKEIILPAVKRGVSFKIMAPITSNNIEAAQELLKVCEVRHIPTGYLGTTIIDGKNLFQFKNYPIEQKEIFTKELFKKTFYTNDIEYVEKTKNMLESIWNNAYSPSAITLETITNIDMPDANSPSNLKMTGATKKINGLRFVKDEKLPIKLTERSLLNKFINARRVLVTDLSKDPVTFYSGAGQAIIHPPKEINLPSMLFHILHLNKKSAFGAEDAMIVMSYMKTPKGYSYVPSAFISDNPEGIGFWRKTFAGIPFEQNIVMKNEFHVEVQHNSLFAGWTKPIQLSTQEHVLPPSCILIEGFGNVRTGKYSIGNPCGDVVVNEVNYFEAFVTYMHPSSKYTGPGTDGFFFREFLSTTYPPSTI